MDDSQPIPAPGLARLAPVEAKEQENIQAAVGRSSATERDPSTSDKFNFWLPPRVIVNPFDIVAVEQVNQPEEPPSTTYGLVTNLEHRTDAPNHLANFISSNFGELDEEPNTPRQGTTVAFANVLSNDADIYMPVPSERLVHFASPEGIERALGIDQMHPADRIPAGLIKMSNGASTVAHIDRRYLLGPESAHVNISGISGLATKTSYAMFLLQAILQTAEDPDDIAVIILNVKHGDLLQIDQRPEKKLPPEQMAMWEALGLEPTPFSNVHYLLPRGSRGSPNSFIEPPISTLFAYDLDSTADKLDLLFTNISDPTSTMESIIGDIMQGLEGRGEASFKNVQSWQNLIYSPPLFDPKARKSKGFGDNRASSVGKFRRHLRRLGIPDEKIIMLPTPIDLDMWNGARAINEEYRVAPHPWVVFIGQMKLRKGFDLLVDAMRLVVQQYPQATFFFISSNWRNNPNYIQLISSIEEHNLQQNFCFLGTVSEDVKWALLANADALAMPSRYEGFGLPLLEAMLAACPIVATDVVAINEVIRNGYNGLLIPLEDAVALAERLSEVIGDKGLAQRLVTGGREYVQQHDVNWHIHHFEAVYQSLLS